MSESQDKGKKGQDDNKDEETLQKGPNLVAHFIPCEGSSLSHVRAVIDAGLVPLIISNLDKSEFRMQAAQAVKNMAISGNRDQVLTLISCRVIPPFCNLLSCKDPEIIRLVLDGVSEMLRKISALAEELENVCALIEECGGLDQIESLLVNHENDDVHQFASDIIENYFVNK